MPVSDFDDFVSRRTVRAKEAMPVDWDKRRQDWLQEVQALYDTIQGYLADYIEGGRITASYEPITLNEERLGSYATQKLILRIGDHTIEFVPIGTVIFGAWGRVDVIGPMGRARLVLVEAKAENARLKVTIVDPHKPREPYLPPPREEWAWKIAGSPPAMTLTELTSQSLQDVIMEVANA